MEPISTSEQPEKETKEESVSATSKRKTSRKSDGTSIARTAKLRILQQAAFDCEATAARFDANTVALIVPNCKLENGNLVPILPRTEGDSQ